MDFQQASAFSYVTLVDRTGLGGTELIYDGVRIVFKPGETEKIVPSFVAEWLPRVTQAHVWTKDGDYVSRFAVRGGDPAMLGPDAIDESPIELDPDRIEGWDTSGTDRSNHRPVKINVPSGSFRERQGGESRSGFGGQE